MNTIPRPRQWLVESILVTLLCCLPLGIVNAANVNARFDAGDYEGALRASKEAGRWTKIGFWLAVVCWAAYLLFYVLIFGVLLAGFAVSM